MNTFIDELIGEAIEKEQQLNNASIDLILAEIKSLQKQITHNFEIAEEEKRIIDEWAIRRNSTLTDRKEFLEQKVKTYFIEQNVSTLDLPNGRIQKRKTPHKLEITDIGLFLENSSDEMLAIVPESRKPDLNKIKAYWKMSRKVPIGTRLVEPIEKITIKIKENGDNDGKEENNIGAE